MTDIDSEKAVQRGAELLDEILPNWRTEVRIYRLDMGDCLECILGQLYGVYDTGLEEVERHLSTDKDSGITGATGAEYGFDIPPLLRVQLQDGLVPGVSSRYQDLTELWIEVIEKDPDSKTPPAST